MDFEERMIESGFRSLKSVGVNTLFRRGFHSVHLGKTIHKSGRQTHTRVTDTPLTGAQESRHANVSGTTAALVRSVQVHAVGVNVALVRSARRFTLVNV